MSPIHIVPVLMAMLSIAATNNGQAKEQMGNGDLPSANTQQQGNTGESRGVDIAGFYANGSKIWIFGDSNYPCKVDIVTYTTENETVFTRWHQDGQSFHRRSLKGEFMTYSMKSEETYEMVFTATGTVYNAMKVSPLGQSSYGKMNAGSWRSTEIMLRDTLDGTCALFQVRYTEQPTPLRGQLHLRGITRGTSRVELEIRVKHSAVGSIKETCAKELQAWYDRHKPTAGAELRMPALIPQCKESCMRSTLCNQALTAEAENLSVN